MKFSTGHLKWVALVAWLVVALGRVSSAADSSLTDLDIEYSELKVALERLLEEKRQLASVLADAQKTLVDMRENLAVSNAEVELYRRRSTELTLRMEALGLSLPGRQSAEIEQRLLTAVSDLRSATSQSRELTEALTRLVDAANSFAKEATGGSAEVRLMLEAEIRNANRSLTGGKSFASGASNASEGLSGGRAISFRKDLSLVVVNLGKANGVTVGMPFRVLRNDRVIGKVQAIDVREKISGAVVQYLTSDKENIQVGDRLVVDTQQ